MSGVTPATGSAPCRFAHYFAVCGIDTDIGLEPEELAGVGLEQSPIQRSFRSKVLAHYPEIPDRGPFNKDTVNMLAMPQGLSFKTQADSREPRFHSFTFTRDDGSRCYGFVLMYYEEVNNIQITTAMHTLTQMHHVAHHSSSSSTSPSSASSPSSSSLGSLASSMDESDGDSLAAGGGAVTGEGAACLGCAGSYDLTRDRLYVSTALCLLTPLPFLPAARHFLSQLQCAVASPQAPPLPLESYIHNILYEVPLPLPGRSLRFHGVGGPMVVGRPSPEELPLGEFWLGEALDLLGLENLLTLLTCCLLETHILLCSLDCQRLMVVAEGVSSLLFPFQWQHVYLPVLPATLQRHLLDAPTPYILGLQRSTAQIPALHLPHQANLCIVDIDGGRVDPPEGLPSFPDRAELLQELSQVLLHFGHLPQGGSTTIPTPPNQPTTPNQPTVSIPSRPSSLVLEDLMEDSRNGNLGGEELAVLERLQALAKRRGGGLTGGRSLEEEEEELRAAVLSVQLREVVANRFVAMFGRYQQFVVHTAADLDSWLSSPDRMDPASSFLKASFLSTQPPSHLPFLSRFLETAMFGRFVEAKITSRWLGVEPLQGLFDHRLETERLFQTDDHKDPGNWRYRKCTMLQESTQALEQRMLKVDHTALHPHLLNMKIGQGRHQPGRFPILQADVLAQPHHANKWSNRGTASRRTDLKKSPSETGGLDNDQREKANMGGPGRSLWHRQLLDSSPSAVVQSQRGFVDGLLRECRHKTKCLLLERIGERSVCQGQGGINALQEKTLILGLWDLLERTWGHGLLLTQGKSALWAHLLMYQGRQNKMDSPAQSPVPASSGGKPRQLEEDAGLPGNSFLQDMRLVQSMEEVSDVGRAQAWVHLVLEKKMLSHHLKQLLADQELLSQLYAPHAFLLSEEEREQFLFHLLSLNTVDYLCFTHTFTKIDIQYRVVIVPMKKLSIAMTTVTPWVCVSGELGESGVRHFPRNSQEIYFQCKNLGRLSTVQLGQEKSGLLSRCLLDCVLVTNQVTGHAYRFPCGQWLGKGVGDGSLERVLIGQLVSPGGEEDVGKGAGMLSPTETGSVSSPLQNGRTAQGGVGGRRMTAVEVQEEMREAVNNLVKHFHTPDTERTPLTGLLCGEKGLANALQLFLLHGLKSSGLFQRSLFIWDFMEKAVVTMETADQTGGLRGSMECRDSLCRYANAINAAPRNMGKEGKFQLLVCLGLRDRLLAQWLPLLAACPLTGRMYEDGSLIRDPGFVLALSRLLHTVQDFPITLETALIKGVEL